jgi:hypothetical protein
MNLRNGAVLAVFSWWAFLAGVGVQSAEPLEAEANQCILCHANADLWEGETLYLFVTPKDLENDIHWQKGIKCQECHGGNPETTNLREAHAIEDGFRVTEKPADIAGFCGHCHSDPKYMARFQPQFKGDPVAKLLGSVHGKPPPELADAQATTCLSCHPHHQMRAASDPQSSYIRGNWRRLAAPATRTN